MTALVHIVDDDPGVLKVLQRVLSSDGLEVTASSTGLEFLARYDPDTTGCIVLDLSMPAMSGLDLHAHLVGKGVRQPVIFLSECDDVSVGVQAMKAGAIDFLVKPIEVAALRSAVRHAIEIDGAARQRRRDRHDAQVLFATLSPREREVVPCLLTGRLNKQIAADLGVCEKTIKVHRSRIMHKLGIRSLVELVRFMDRMGTASGTPFAA